MQNNKSCKITGVSSTSQAAWLSINFSDSVILSVSCLAEKRKYVIGIINLGKKEFLSVQASFA